MRVTSLLKGTNSSRESFFLACVVSETILLYLKHFLLKRNLHSNIEENTVLFFSSGISYFAFIKFWNIIMRKKGYLT